MRVGVQLPEAERVVGWSEYGAMARAAEDVGLDSIWVGDHLLYRDGRGERGPLESWTLLAALAAVTERVRLGPLVACAGFHVPAVLAKKAATLAEVSDGRFVLGLGAGWNETEFRAFGVPFDRRVSRFAEAFEIVRRLLAGEAVTIEGRYWQTDDAVLLPPPRRVPLMVGSSGERMLSLTLPHVDAWNAWYAHYGNTPDEFARLNAEISVRAEAAGRRPGEVERSACVLVDIEPGGWGRPDEPGIVPVPISALPEHLAALTEAGADEAVLVLRPITAASIRAAGEALR